VIQKPRTSVLDNIHIETHINGPARHSNKTIGDVGDRFTAAVGGLDSGRRSCATVNGFFGKVSLTRGLFSFVLFFWRQARVPGSNTESHQHMASKTQYRHQKRPFTMIHHLYQEVYYILLHSTTLLRLDGYC